MVHQHQSIDGKAYDLAIGLSLVGTKTVAKKLLHGVNHAIITMEGEAAINYETKGDGNYKASIKESSIKTTITTDQPGQDPNTDGPPPLKFLEPLNPTEQRPN